MSWRKHRDEQSLAHYALRHAAEVIYTQVRPEFREHISLSTVRDAKTGTIMFNVRHPHLNNGKPVLMPVPVPTPNREELRDQAMTFLLMTVC
jgi:hypothetical protein